MSKKQEQDSKRLIFIAIIQTRRGGEHDGLPEIFLLNPNSAIALPSAALRKREPELNGVPRALERILPDPTTVVAYKIGWDYFTDEEEHDTACVMFVQIPDTTKLPREGAWRTLPELPQSSSLDIRMARRTLEYLKPSPSEITTMERD